MLESLVERLCSSLSQDLATDGVHARHIVLKVKRSDFTVKQYSFSLPCATSSAVDLTHVAVRLLHKAMPATLRLVGVKVSRLVAVNSPSGGNGIDAGRGILRKAIQSSDSACVTLCPICLKAITGEPPNVRLLTLCCVAAS